MNNDVYIPPKSNIMDHPSGEKELASRLQRFFASLLDTWILMLFIFPIMLVTGGFMVFRTGAPPTYSYNVFLAAIGLAVFLILNGALLIKNGQTIGKKILGIKILSKEGGRANLKNHLLKRYAVYILPGYVPLIGGLFSLANILFIFGKSRQCLHDRIASTIVVRV